MKPYLAKVTWYDTVDCSTWDSVSDVNIQKVEQWGWVVSRDSTQLKIADTFSKGEWFGITAIPKSCITNIEKLHASPNRKKRKHNVVQVGGLREVVSNPPPSGVTG
jgi:hypothetical protein